MMNDASVIQHITLVGFHHKKGCQVEFVYPPFNQEDSSLTLPEEWKSLPSLCLPDGSHNHQQDTVYFNLPGKTPSTNTVYGISCFRQIESNKLSESDSSITRNSVQKSVCVLSRLPLYGLIRAKLEIITHAYFEEKDFSQQQLLVDAFQDLNISITPKCLTDSKICFGLDLTRLMLQWKHKLVILFKLIMLEKRVLFWGSPVEPVCSLIVALLSLFPSLLESGLVSSSALSVQSRRFSGTPFLAVSSSEEGIETIVNNAEKHTQPKKTIFDEKYVQQPGQTVMENMTSAPAKSSISQDKNGFPYLIFTNNVLLRPYLSLQCFDVLHDSRLRGIIMGASNALFLQRRNLFDVVVNVPEVQIDFIDAELASALSLTTADLRFADFLLEDTRAEDTAWEGGEEWLRSQFRTYLLALSATCFDKTFENEKLLEDFNIKFVEQWKLSRHFKLLSSSNSGQFELPPGHPFQGHLNMTDIKSRISYTMMNTEHGKRLNTVVMSTGKAVVQSSKIFVGSGKVLGGAISTARSTMSSWLLGFSENAHSFIKQHPENVDSVEMVIADESFKMTQDRGDNMNKLRAGESLAATEDTNSANKIDINEDLTE